LGGNEGLVGALYMGKDGIGVEGVKGEVVDLEDDAAADRVGDLVRADDGGRGVGSDGGGGDGGGVLPDVRGARHLVEIGDGFEGAVLVELEVILLEALDHVALPVGDDDVDVDDPDLHRVDD